ncbi:MAG TPA: HNH endonuclease family protein, partial [Candidatus Kapabacteria bacterium]|nr:HNH endonuclease family protein [Candidatus Kapabacteria bacterium]
ELKLFGVKQPLSLLLTAYEKLDEEKFEKMLRIISILSFRYNVIGSLNANDQEKVYNTIAMKMHGGSGFSTNDFNQIYPSDDEFTTAFSNKEFKPTSRNNQVVRYIFGRLESFVCQHEIEYESERYTIEHILPESPSEEWNISEDAYERCVYRLGNLCILEKNLNQKIENKVYSIKKPVLEKSSVKLTIRIAEENSEWNEDKISKRQSWLAKQAKSIWVIN